MLCIVEVTRSDPKGRNIWVKEIYPNPNDEEVFATMTTNMPLSQAGGGIYSIPKPEPGIKCVAMRYSYQFFILGFFSDFNPQSGWRQTVDLDEELELNDINIRTPAGNRVTLENAGRVSIFANLWSRLHLSQKLEELSGYFKKIRMTWFGGSLKATDELFKLTLTDGYEDPEVSDIDLDTEQLPNSGTASFTGGDPTLLANTYRDKAIIDNAEVPFRVETRQRVRNASQPQQKDSYTIEKRGRGESDDIYSLETIDRDKGIITKNSVDGEGAKTSVLGYPAITGLPGEEETNVDFQLTTNLGEKSSLQYETLDHAFETSISSELGEDRFKLVTNNDSVSIGDIFAIKRVTDDGEELVTIEFDDGGVLNIKTPHAQIRTDAETPSLYITVLEGGNIQLGGEELLFDASTGDSVLTPKTILDGVGTDTFTGIPWAGSKTVAAKE